MFKGIVFRDEVEDLVQFVEETDPSEIIERTLDKLRAGTPAVDLLRAGALAVCRSTELPPEHHGGPVHPICGIHGVYNTSRRLSGEMAFMPIVQHVALCNNHVHSPQMGAVHHACDGCAGRHGGDDRVIPPVGGDGGVG